MLFYCSNAMVAFLTTHYEDGSQASWVSPTRPKNAEQRWAWQLHCIELAGKQVMIALERGVTRFAIVLWDIDKDETSHLISQLHRRIEQHFLLINERVQWLSEEEARQAMRLCWQQNAQIDFVRGVDPSVQNHINVVARACEQYVQQHGGLAQDEHAAMGFEVVENVSARRIGDGPDFRPDERFFYACLQHYRGASLDECLQVRERFVAWYQTQELLWRMQPRTD
ncbi:hypothetical protein HZU77_004835 [Neisseriaceae bacterium TC5R-5]|nr:hypothetical protein [Neisseriaceae bacterium TC5R-5]